MNTISPQGKQVVRWLTEGHDATDISEAILEKAPGADPKAAIAEAVAYLAKQGELDVALVTGWAAEAYRELYRRMVSVGDFANAMRAVKFLTDLTKARAGAQPAPEEKRIDVDDIQEEPRT